MHPNIFGFCALVVLAGASALAVYVIMKKSLDALITDLTGIKQCSEFYTRLLAIGLLLIAFSAILGTSFTFGPSAAFMEYVWHIASGLSTAYSEMIFYISAFLILVTILVAALRHKSDQ